MAPLSRVVLALLFASVRGTAVAAYPTSARELHQAYGLIFRHGSRNAASHLWASYVLGFSAAMPRNTLELLFSSFCAVSGSPVTPSDYKRYRLNLTDVSGASQVGFLYYCCWPCVCDTHDFIRVDTKTIQTAEGQKVYRFAVIGNPCSSPKGLDAPFVQPFDQRTTTLRREAPEVRCGAGGDLLGAMLSDHGYVIIAMFFDAPEEAVHRGYEQPGRVTTLEGTNFQSDTEFDSLCAQRAANGYDSGMGEIFRRVAALAPIPETPRLLDHAAVKEF
ncbi:hypothetical protein M885DRAFT_460878 [Pelagophyceae sp. CCMP2097]|nr:hypothetical protein M885DRAFT_460878 [Pelagophyceae sp. CCMP2097]